MQDKILMLTSTFPKNTKDSTPSFVFDLSYNLSKNYKYDITILAPYSNTSKKEESWDNVKILRYKYFSNKFKLISDGAIVPNLKKNPLFWFQVPFLFISLYYNTSKLIKKNNFKIVHAHWIFPQGLVIAIYNLFHKKKVKLITTIHGADLFTLNKLNFLKKYVLKRTDKVVVVSNYLKNEVLKLNDNLKIDVIPMGVDTDRFKFSNKTKQEIFKKYQIKSKLLLFVGRLSEKKGLIYLLEAFKEVVKQEKNLKLMIIGDGEKKEEILSFIENNHLKDNIIFLNGITHREIHKYFIAADIFIGPSIIAKNNDQEGFGLVFAEALASNCLVLASNLNSIKDIIFDKKTGILIKQKDISDIKRNILYALENTNYNENIINNGRKHVENNFSWKIISNKYNNLYKIFK